MGMLALEVQGTTNSLINWRYKVQLSTKTLKYVELALGGEDPVSEDRMMQNHVTQ